jgi:hypothetical protein
MVKCGVVFEVETEFLNYYLVDIRLQRVNMNCNGSLKQTSS